MAMEKLKEGNVDAASDLFQKAINITPSMVHQLIQVLKSENVEFVVAPYEADAQLAYLSSLGEKDGGIHAVISEDSDMLAYGCPSVIFKMDRFGKGEEIVVAKVFNSTDVKPSFRNFNRALFLDSPLDVPSTLWVGFSSMTFLSSLSLLTSGLGKSWMVNAHHLCNCGLFSSRDSLRKSPAMMYQLICRCRYRSWSKC